jgi:hypothetical protein
VNNAIARYSGISVQLGFLMGRSLILDTYNSKCKILSGPIARGNHLLHPYTVTYFCNDFFLLISGYHIRHLRIIFLSLLVQDEARKYNIES